MGDNWEDSYLTYNTTGGDDSSSSRSFRSVDDNSSTQKRTLPIMSRTNFYIMLKDKLERLVLFKKLYDLLLMAFLTDQDTLRSPVSSA